MQEKLQFLYNNFKFQMILRCGVCRDHLMLIPRDSIEIRATWEVSWWWFESRAADVWIVLNIWNRNLTFHHELPRSEVNFKPNQRSKSNPLKCLHCSIGSLNHYTKSYHSNSVLELLKFYFLLSLDFQTNNLGFSSSCFMFRCSRRLPNLGWKSAL